MHKKIIQSLANSWPYFLLLTIFLLIYAKVVPISDDVYHNSVLSRFNGSVISALIDYYYLWGGKIVPHSLWLSLLGLDFWVYRILSSFVLVGLVYATYRLIYFPAPVRKERNYALLLVASLLFFIPYKTFYFGSLWASGSFAYLYPAAAMVVALLPVKWYFFDNQKVDNWKYWIFYPAALYASYSEQTAMVLLAFLIGGLGYKFVKKESVDPKFFVYSAFILINCLVCITAPGNAVRKVGEFIWFTNYDMLAITDKFLLGANIALNHIYFYSYFLIIIAVAIVYKLWTKRREEIILSVLGTLAATYAVLCQILPSNALLFFALPSPSTVSDISSYLGLIAGSSIMLFFSYLIYRSFDKAKTGTFYAILFLLAFLSTAMLGFSPTIYASGERIFFLTDLLLSIISAALLRELYLRRPLSSLPKILIVIVYLFAAIVVITHVFTVGLLPI